MALTWREVWEEGFAPRMPLAGLEALAEALRDDDPRLVQGATTTPPPLACVAHWEVNGACVLGFCGWQGKSLKTVGEVNEFFAEACFNCDEAIGEPAACRWFLNWYDKTPRPEMRSALLPLVESELARRAEPPKETP